MKKIHVAVGVVQDTEGKICVAKRPEGKHLAGLWEFPGGKVEQGESAFDALKRELFEELSIIICSSEALTRVDFAYPEKCVFLDVHVVRDFTGVAKGCENQEVLWVGPETLSSMTFPEANAPIVEAILNLKHPS